MQHYKWSKSGLELLQRIAGVILKNGGNIRFALAIEKEWMNKYQLEKAKKRFIGDKHPWSQTEINFLKANLHLSYEDISLQMKDRTPQAVRQKIFRLQEVKQLGSKILAKKEYNNSIKS